MKANAPIGSLAFRNDFPAWLAHSTTPETP